jgi:hypothetical protein
MNGEAFLEHAAGLVTRRRREYGEPVDLFEHIATRWSLTLGTKVRAGVAGRSSRRRPVGSWSRRSGCWQSTSGTARPGGHRRARPRPPELTPMAGGVQKASMGSERETVGGRDADRNQVGLQGQHGRGGRGVFNQVYNQEHVPNLLKVPGVRAVTRLEGEPFALGIGGERKEMPAGSPRYTAIYEIDGPEVLASDAWARAVEAGRWPGEVRP